MKKKIFGLVLLIISIGCSDLETIQSPGELDINKYGTYVDATLEAVSDTFIIGGLVNTANASKLQIGVFENFQAGFLLRFKYLPPDSIAVDSVCIEFTSDKKFGSGEGDINVAIYEVTESWEESANSEETWHEDNLPLNLIGNAVFSLEDSAEYNIFLDDMDPALFSKWQQDDSVNYGLYFKIDETGSKAIKDIYSFESSAPPKLIFRIDQDTIFVRDTITTGEDASIFDYPVQGGENIFENAGDELYISSGITAHTFIKFDFSAIPKNAIIQSADLQISIDKDNTLDNSNHSAYYYLRSVEEAEEDLSSYTIDSSFVYYSKYDYFATDIGDTISLDKSNQVMLGENLIQGIVNEKITSEWFYLQYMNESMDIAVKKLYGLPDQPPILIIRYIRVDKSGL